MIFAGIGLAILSWGSLLVLLLASIIVYGYRIKVEEKALVAKFVEEYVAYMGETKMLVEPKKSVETKVPVETRKESEKFRVTKEEKKDLHEEIKEVDKKSKGKFSRKPYSLQLGMFRNKDNAVSIAEKYKKKGYSAFLEKDTTQQKETTLYRVLIGSFATRKEAERNAKSFRTKEKDQVIIYRE